MFLVVCQVVSNLPRKTVGDFFESVVDCSTSLCTIQLSRCRDFHLLVLMLVPVAEQACILGEKERGATISMPNEYLLGCCWLRTYIWQSGMPQHSVIGDRSYQASCGLLWPVSRYAPAVQPPNHSAPIEYLYIFTLFELLFVRCLHPRPPLARGTSG